jgi:hypothetical protein
LQEADLLLAALQQRYGEISGESLADPHGDRVVRVPRMVATKEEGGLMESLGQLKGMQVSFLQISKLLSASAYGSVCRMSVFMAICHRIILHSPEKPRRDAQAFNAIFAGFPQARRSQPGCQFDVWCQFTSACLIASVSCTVKHVSCLRCCHV